ncbi:MAG: flagellar basal-body rod protein FlgF [Treponemataceae bacterium]|uniref:flagellar basal-body rod protein FlgF n=1 Tax=Treponema sp. J25 TaxID=2094121 RepID=UPI001050B302|nr:flagellar basal-body rod protein FlgF [Treponema sp. J25]MCX7948573.1 flagellar basal-body rod protein FlgF [Treponemataceae bacterium]HOJ99073.1 flagellar basal-body rod protein FlgF [Termitinemataceae bacterium]TCW60313.1 flagellar basal-body rod protein FlgF [Treponema sp. J25]HOM22955.1 flagellar basal-body rod protein FlgF [Termitinemataceae bacterium]HPQ00296.1 flagellar basal-body rod protein FlgF [Termitinemataceae bacterium]
MIRGWYTGASGMTAQQYRLDAVANNLANVDTDGYKKDVAIHKAFPELLLRRLNDDGVYLHPFGSADAAPIIGKIGTGVETNELFTIFEQGALKETESDFDVALDGKGFFTVATPWGERYTRNGSFQLGKEGYLETKDGYPVLGEHGPIRVKEHNFKIDKDGRVWVNAEYPDDPEVFTSKESNTWSQTVLLDTLKIVEFENDRYLAKQGNSLYKDTDVSGPARIIEEGRRPKVIQGFVEASNVNPVIEMVQMIEVNRAYEANQKVIQAEDGMLGKLINEVVRV